MRFQDQLLEGTLIGRSKRFEAQVRLHSGEEIVAHCANPGSLMGCAEPGSKVLVSLNTNPRIKFKHQLEIIYAGKTPVGVHVARPVTVVAEAIGDAKIRELAGYATLRRASRKTGAEPNGDLILEGNGLRPCHIVVHNVTFAQEGVCFYPDAPDPDGTDELSDLTNLVREGNRAVIFLVAQRGDVSAFRLAEHIDDEYAQAFRDAAARGVEVLAWRSKVQKRSMELDAPLAIDLGGEQKK